MQDNIFPIAERFVEQIEHLKVEKIESAVVRNFFQNFARITLWLLGPTDSLNTCSTGVCLPAITFEMYFYVSCYEG